MIEFFKFLDSYEALIYILLAIAGLFSLRWLWRSWNEWRIAIYRLEKEFSVRRLGQSAAISTLIVVVFCGLLSITSFIRPNLPAEMFIPTSTADFISTPTGTLSPEMLTQFASQPLQPASADTQGCVPGQVEFTSPKPNEEIKGTIDLIGTVNISSFGFYKYEVAPNGGSNWATISADRVTVVNNSLGRWDTTALTPGDYQLRLVVTDNQGNSLPPCIIPVRVVPAN